MSVDDFDVVKFVLCSRVVVVTELVVSGTQCNTVGFLLGDHRFFFFPETTAHNRKCHQKKLNGFTQNGFSEKS